MKLVKFDRVALVSPASQMRGADLPLLPQAIELLRSWGLDVEDMTSSDHHFYLAGRDEARAAAFKSALEDPGIRAIFCTRGGYGGPRLYPHLADLAPDCREKYLIGYSDITSLHLAVASRAPDVVRVHGPNVATSQFLGDSEAAERSRRSLHDLLFCGPGAFSEPIHVLRSGHAEGPLEGGCLSLLVSALGTPFAPSARGGIAFIEDTGEPPYKIDRMLTQLKNAGYFQGVRGIVFGQMKKCTDPHNDLVEVILDVLADFPGPVGMGLSSGHGEVNLSLALGKRYELDCAKGVFSRRV